MTKQLPCLMYWDRHHQMPANDVIWVVKIGGSLAGDEKLVDWLSVISRSRQSIVVVPGGGPFADQVRTMQSRWDFTESTAHRMAILAMHQYGLMLADINTDFVTALSVYEVKKKLNQGLSLIIWLPDLNELQCARIPESWDVSADSLAAWLCSRLDAERLILIKSIDARQSTECSINAVHREGIVDNAFLKMMAGVNCSTFVLGKAQFDLFL